MSKAFIERTGFGSIRRISPKSSRRLGLEKSELNPLNHILICSYEYGPGSGPEGICTYRLAMALVQEGIRVTVLTSDFLGEFDGTASIQVLQISTYPFKPQPFWRFFSKVLANWRFLGRDYHIFWQNRLAHMDSPVDIDLVYGRSMPLSGVIAAWRLARRNRLPLFVHFSDPVISPWYMPTGMPLHFLRWAYRSITRKSLGVSFVTSQALSYTERTMSVPLGEKAFVLPHVAPSPMRFGPPKNGNVAPVFLYAGSFYGTRNPRCLLDGFALFLQKEGCGLFRFFGADEDLVLREARQLGISESVEVFPFTQNITETFRSADILVALDASEGDPVFMSTKIVDYLMVDRVILLVSPVNSPSSQLVARFPETTITVPENPTEIAAAMADLVRREHRAVDFARRFAGMEEFSPTNVAKKFLEIVELKAGTPL